MGLALWEQEGITRDHVVIADKESSGTALILVYNDGDTMCSPPTKGS
jgi:sugar/nucleoside kinase (ribokinase family)